MQQAAETQQHGLQLAELTQPIGPAAAGPVGWPVVGAVDGPIRVDLRLWLDAARRVAAGIAEELAERGHLAGLALGDPRPTASVSRPACHASSSASGTVLASARACRAVLISRSASMPAAPFARVGPPPWGRRITTQACGPHGRPAGPLPFPVDNCGLWTTHVTHTSEGVGSVS